MSDSTQRTPYPLRLSAELRHQLNERAKQSGRSLHGEIISRLEQSLTVDQVPTNIADISDEAAEKIAKAVIKNLRDHPPE